MDEGVACMSSELHAHKIHECIYIKTCFPMLSLCYSKEILKEASYIWCQWRTK